MICSIATMWAVTWSFWRAIPPRCATHCEWDKSSRFKVFNME